MPSTSICRTVSFLNIMVLKIHFKIYLMFQPEYIEEEGPEPGYPAGLFSNSQTVLILTVMVGCFGVLWPKGAFRNLEITAISKLQSLLSVTLGSICALCLNVILDFLAHVLW